MKRARIVETSIKDTYTFTDAEILDMLVQYKIDLQHDDQVEVDFEMSCGVATGVVVTVKRQEIKND